MWCGLWHLVLSLIKADIRKPDRASSLASPKTRSKTCLPEYVNACLIFTFSNVTWFVHEVLQQTNKYGEKPILDDGDLERNEPQILFILLNIIRYILNDGSDNIVQSILVFFINNLAQCSPKVFLLPSVLARKRIWNPKYPICIQLAEASNSQGDGTGILENNLGREQGTEPSTPQQNSFKNIQELPTTLYLFGRTGREKEEWFRHFLFASINTEWEKQREERPGRCVSRLGMRNL